MRNTVTKSAIICCCVCIVLSCRAGVILQNGVDEDGVKQILRSHNQLRAMVAKGQQPGQPGAENMMEMVWDKELAEHAQKWADQCIFQHDPARVVDRFTMGQNIAIIWSTAPIDNEGDFPSRIRKWFDEVNAYKFGARWSPKTGHYSQLVWSETHLVGCGFTYYQTSNKWNKIFVCNYGPGGNVEGLLPYAVGTPSCVHHGMSTSSQYPGLCGIKKTTHDKRLNGTRVIVDDLNKFSNIFNKVFTSQALPSEPQRPVKTFLESFSKLNEQKRQMGIKHFRSTETKFTFKQINNSRLRSANVFEK